MEHQPHILILSCSTGEGHNSAAWALHEAFERRGAAVEVVDPVGLKSQKAGRTVAALYNNTIKKAPLAFGAVYHLGAAYSATRIPSPVYWANAKCAPVLRDHIRENGIDAVVCTHLYGMEAMAAARKRLGVTTPWYSVMTDYTCIPFTTEPKADALFSPHPALTAEIIRKGGDPDRIIPYGIPVSARFSQPIDKADARRQLDIPPDKPVYLIMSGGVGCENILRLCDAMNAESRGYLCYVLTGHNDDLLQKLERRYGEGGKIRPVGFTRQVHLYMKAADVMISKSGGLSSTEAAVAGVPLIHFKPIPGCESKNRDFFRAHGMALSVKNNADAVKMAGYLARHTDRAAQMLAAQKATLNPHAADDIVRHVLQGVTS
ncbi:MAG: MGDG synthase family glycosyltransferase [Acutalibacteraceae bacterium]|jgi:processive 1,2-diacylglycerol beta-glucosyltransferase